MIEWQKRTPDGHLLRVIREEKTWIVRCGEVDEARSELLDVALFEAVRSGSVVAHSAQPEYGAWIQEVANEIETLQGGGEYDGQGAAPKTPEAAHW